MKKEKLYCCSYCRRPMMILKPPPKKEDGTRMKKGWRWVAGPSTYPKVKRWCDGSCDGLALHFFVIKEDVTAVFKKHKNLKWLLLVLEEFRCELTELLKARDGDRVPISKEGRKIREKLRKLRKTL